MNSVAIIDYGVGNVSSVYNMLKWCGINASIITKPVEIHNHSAAILPGVGNYDFAINALRSRGFEEEMSKFVEDNDKLFIGICLGMQLLGMSSEEGTESGLGWINGEVKYFSGLNEKLLIPHMGWNYVSSSSDLFDSDIDTRRFYFVHSYHFVCDEKDILCVTEYGGEFVSAINRGNIYGFQFHPEKSHVNGKKLLSNIFIKHFGAL